jgi:diguanylate cyclase (GGDEF)-like protein
MLKRLYSREDVPQEVADQLAEMVFSAPTAILLYVICLIIAAPTFWWCSHDFWIAVAAVTSIVLNLSRIAVVFFFKRRNPDGDWVRSPTYWTLVYALGGCFSLNMAVLVARAFFVGQTASIALAVILASGYLMGVIMRASAVPRLAVPHLLLLFVPLIVLAACVPERGYLVVALLLGLFCVGCVTLGLNVHRRTKGQLLAEYQLSLLARMDHLTGLANRGSLDAQGALLLQKARASRCSYAVALIDLDGFKSVNDTYGHAAGDEFLKEISARIKAVLGGRHFPARLGGDEFAIVFDPDTELDDAIAVGNQVVSILTRPFRIAGTTLQISGSVGIARLEGSADTFASIVERADKALYRAKNAGRNQVLVAPDLSPSIVPAAISASADVLLVGA